MLDRLHRKNSYWKISFKYTYIKFTKEFVPAALSKAHLSRVLTKTAISWKRIWEAIQ